MKTFILILAFLMTNMAFAGNDAANAQLSFSELEAANRNALISSIGNAIKEHYQTLSTNEQWGVGMGCTLGGMVDRVRASKTIQVNDEDGLIVAQVGYQPHAIKGPTRHTIYINFTPGTQEINKVTIVSQSRKGHKSSCSTRDGLFRYFSELNALAD